MCIDGSSVLFDEVKIVSHARGEMLEGFVRDEHASIEDGSQP
jgi:hypothetical protein